MPDDDLSIDDILGTTSEPSVDEILGTDETEDALRADFREMAKDDSLEAATFKQLMWLNFYLNTDNCKTFMNAFQSAKAAGYSVCGRRSNAATHNRKRFASFIKKWLDDVGMGEVSIKAKVMRLTDATETKILKIKGAVNKSELPDHIKVLSQSGVIEEDKEGEFYGSGETVLAIEMESLGTQTKNIEIATKLYGLNAPDKLQLSGGMKVIALDEKDQKA